MKTNSICRLLATLFLLTIIAPQANAAAVNSANKLGGATSFTYQYDDLYRLTGATGVWSKGNTSESFTLAMDYDSIHNIVGKDQNHIRTTPGNAIIPQHKTTYDWMYTYAASQPHAASLIGDRAYSYDLNGNQLGWDHVSNGTRRTITWDEENRIQAIADNGHTLTYVYDDAGERVIKSGPQGETAYVNQFFVVRNRAVATKHIFAGGTRLVSKMTTQPDATSPTAGNSDQAPWGWLHSNAGGNSPNSGGTVFEKDQYYFHPDHLGSSSYVTDIDGEIFQHLEYFPFGETFVEESSNTQRTPYLFTGKELDEATGLYYFGARYYDPRTSVWQSPDPILASYMQGAPTGGVYDPKNLNLYGYVANNPLNEIDPNGKVRCTGDDRCEAVHKAAEGARHRILKTRDATNSLRRATGRKGGLTAAQQGTKDRFEEFFGAGSATKANLGLVSKRLGVMRRKIGAPRRGADIIFGGARKDVAASAPPGGKSFTIFDAFFDDGSPQVYYITHESGHLAKLRDLVLPAGAPKGIGRFKEETKTWIAYGIGAARWLGANDPATALENNDNLHCFILGAGCGGP